MYLILLLTCSLLLKCQRNPYLLSNYNHQLHYFMRMAKSTKSMPTSSSASSSYSATSLRCYAHVPETTGDMPFKRTTWSTYLRCVGIWKDLVGNQADIARCFIRDHGGISCGLEEIPIPDDGGYYRKCYNYFTDSSKQARALKKKQETNATSPAGRQWVPCHNNI